MPRVGQENDYVNFQEAKPGGDKKLDKKEAGNKNLS